MCPEWTSDQMVARAGIEPATRGFSVGKFDSPRRVNLSSAALALRLKQLEHAHQLRRTLRFSYGKGSASRLEPI